MNAFVDLTKSFLSLSWGMTLFAPEQAWRTAAAPFSRQAAERAEHGFDDVAWTAGEQLGTWNEIFLAGDSLQRDLTDLGLAALPQNPLDPGQWLERARFLAAATPEAMRFFVPDRDGLLAWRELGNKVEVYRLVKQVADRIGTPGPGEPFDLPTLVARSYALDPYAALWAVEGLGHDYAKHFWSPDGPPVHGLLGPDVASGLPAKSLLMLHAGIGLGFAEPLIGALDPIVDRELVEATVRRVVDLCRDNSLRGDVGAAWESLGLYTRSFHPQMLAPVDAALRRVAPQALGYYWRGVGRAYYFLPVNFLPCGRVTWRPFEMAREQSPDDETRRGAWAGIAWAITLVNMRQPEVLARLLIAPHGNELAADDAFVNGVASSLIMRWDTTPGAPLIEEFLAYRPRGDRQLARLWEELIVAPAERALNDWYPVLRRREILGEVFRYQDLAALVAQPERG
jgi:hypothetical protein